MTERAAEEVPKKVYTYQDLIKFSNMEIYSGFGDVKDSRKSSAPQYSFGTSNRDADPKKYISKEMSIIDCYGKQTPKGPNYIPTDKFSYSKGAQWKIGTAPRTTLDQKGKYEYYSREDIDFDPNQADKARRVSNGRTRFGGGSRFPIADRRFKMTPGPEYNPALRPEIVQPPQFSLYSRRAVKGFDPLILLNSTSEIVGPGSYHPQKSANTSKTCTKPSWSISKGPREGALQSKWQLNQTYDTSSSIGHQTKSQKPTKPYFSMAKQKRENVAGVFKAHMENKPIQVSIKHPKI